jgi:ferritin-like metal-binding protein YciE
MSAKDMLVAWLNDAYAMENGIVQVLEKQVDQANELPQLQSAIQEHLGQTRRHADLVKQAVEHLGGSTSALKTGMANVSGWMQGLSTGPAEDSIVNNGISDFATEHFEIASYQSIIAAAQELGDEFVVGIARQIIPDEEWMAKFLQENQSTVVQQTLAAMAAGAAS